MMFFETIRIGSSLLYFKIVFGTEAFVRWNDWSGVLISS